MLIAAEFPFLDVFATMVLFFTWLAWIWPEAVKSGSIEARTDLD
jgi:hypothetical protein